MAYLSLLLVALLACSQDEETTYTQYNAEDNSVEVQVGSDTVLEAVSVTLTSNTGEVDIGTGTVDPGGGPIGTVHRVSVVLAESYASDVDRATVRTDSGDRGEDEYTLLADSAEEGVWAFELESSGEPGETRTDTLTFRLWTEDAAEE